MSLRDAADGAERDSIREEMASVEAEMGEEDEAGRRR